MKLERFDYGEHALETDKKKAAALAKSIIEKIPIDQVPLSPPDFGDLKTLVVHPVDDSMSAHRGAEPSCVLTSLLVRPSCVLASLFHSLW